ncbi:hypothetical protein [uncultured Leifsonia sp.]|uniref:hypothetical protein n=1 Tax=uncultured Leifsonia sp. TaxID=340359 RepID=UPI0025F8A1A4|nr:hypothetical protein [uncultured Leifsonia sp.]
MARSPSVFAKRGPAVLELRIHGIKNTPPGEMLGVAPGDVRADQADENGGFYVPTVDPVDPEDPATPPTVIRREAYSWGMLARYGGGALVAVGQFFVQLAWLLILPFGLCNTAYWTRPIPDQARTGEWRAGRGAASLRVFALGLTLLYVCALASVSLDLIGTQCLARPALCPALPGWVTGFFEAPGLDHRGIRVAVLSLVPIAGVLLLFFVSHQARTRYEAGIFGTVAKIRTASDVSGVAAGQPAAPRRPLATDGFWGITRVRLPSELLHVAAAFFLVSLLIGWDGVFGSCAPAGLDLPAACFDPVTTPLLARWWLTAAAALAAVGLVAVVALVVRQSDTTVAGRAERAMAGAGATERDERRHALIRAKLRRRDGVAGWMLVVAATVYVVVAVSVAVPDAAVDRHAPSFLGLVIAPSIILGVLLAIALSALGWRRGVPRWLSIGVVVVGGVALLVAVVSTPRDLHLAPPTAAAYGIAALCAALLTALVVFWPMGRHRGFAYQGWRGTGPGVIMLLSLGAAMLLSTLLVLGSQCALASTGSAPVCPLSPGGLTTPVAYRNFGGMVPVLAVLLAVFVLVVALLRMRTTPRLTTPETIGGRALREPLRAYRDGRVPLVKSAGKLDFRMLRARRSAALFHRGEPVLGVLAGLLALGVVVAIALPQPLRPALLDLALPALGLIAVAAVVTIAENALTTKERPIGVMWDLMCFLPRAGHPFGPPCYAERVIPELRDRIVAWLEADLAAGGVEDRRTAEQRARDELRALTTRQRRKVILSAHSLGAVLAVSAIFTLGADTSGGLKNLGLLTYGTQLRAYFGRFFPELFGPEALGTLPSRGPSLWKADPWLRQVIEDHGTDGSGGRDIDLRDKPTLRELLTQPDGRVAWVNLWRRTDYLGFPDASFKDNEIDRGADEFGPPLYLVKVATHPGYQASSQYMGALRDLMRRV